MRIEHKVLLIKNSFGKTQNYEMTQQLAMTLYDALTTVAMEIDKNVEKTDIGTLVSMDKGFVITRPFKGQFSIHLSGRLTVEEESQLIGSFNDTFMSILLTNDF